jgi:hypothetical protein
MTDAYPVADEAITSRAILDALDFAAIEFTVSSYRNAVLRVLGTDQLIRDEAAHGRDVKQHGQLRKAWILRQSLHQRAFPDAGPNS